MKTEKLLPLAILAGLLAGCEEETQPVPELRPVRTILADAKPRTDERVAVGEVRPRQQSDLSFRIAGKVLSRHVNVGETVEKGELIARLDATDYSNRLKAAEADVRAAKAAYDEAVVTESRQRQLLDKGVATRASYDSAKKLLVSSEAALQSANIAVTMAVDQVNYSELRAELSGVVTAVGAEPEQVVNTGQMVVRLAPATAVDAVFAVAEAALQEHFFAANATVEVALLSDPKVIARGNVREVSPIADPATRTFEVKVTLKDPPAQMLFGSAVTGRVSISAKSGMELPSSAIFDSKGKPAVWVYEPASKAVSLKPVAIAELDEGRVVVAAGIAAGERVVTAGVNQLREGQEVRLVEEVKP